MKDLLLGPKVSEFPISRGRTKKQIQIRKSSKEYQSELSECFEACGLMIFGSYQNQQFVSLDSLRSYLELKLLDALAYPEASFLGFCIRFLFHIIACLLQELLAEL